MLRITTSSSDGTQGMLLQLEGRIMGPWVVELQRVCDGYLTRGLHLELDLSGVTFVGARGVRALAALRQQGASVSHCDPFVSVQLREA